MNNVFIPDGSFGLNFYLDKGRDKEILFNWFKHDDPAGLESRAREKGISVEFACRLRDASTYQEVREEIDVFVDGLYEIRGEQLQLFIADLKSYWGENLGQLTAITQELTERSFYYPQYRVLVSVCHMGGVSGGISNDILIGINVHPDWRNRILAHELVEEHWRKIFREEPLTRQLDDWQCWALSEIGAVLVLKDERLRRLWSHLPPGMDSTGYFEKSNYSQLAPLEMEIREAFLVRKNLEEFLGRAANVLTKYSNLHKPFAGLKI